MSILPELWSVLMGTTGQVLGWTLLHFLWQGVLVAALLAVSLRLLRGHGPHVRYLVGCGALILLAGLPVGTAMFLSERGPPAPSSDEPLVIHEGSGEEVSPREATSASSPGNWMELGTWADAQVPNILPWIVMAWGIGVLACLGRLFGGFWHARRLRRSAAPAPTQWRKRVDDLADRFGLNETVTLRCSQHVSVPTVAGWWKPVLLVPTGFLTGLPPAHVEGIILHELAHVRRHDILITRIQTLCETVFFYHPATWWISRRVRQIREHCCDDRVLETNVDRVAYARALASLAEQACTKRSPAISPTAGDGKLLTRVRRILTSSDSPSLPKQVSATLTAGLLLIGGSFGAMYAVGPALTSDAIAPTTEETASVVLTQDSTGAVIIEPSQQVSPNRTSKSPPSSGNSLLAEELYADLDQRWEHISPDSLLRSVRANFDLDALNDRLGNPLPRDLLRASLHIHPDTLQRSTRGGSEALSLDMIHRAVQAQVESDSSNRPESLPVRSDVLRRAVQKEINVSLSRTLREKLNADTLERGVKIRVKLGDSSAELGLSGPRKQLRETRAPKKRLLTRRSDHVNQPDSVMSRALEKTLQDTTIILGQRRTIVRDTGLDDRPSKES